MANVAALEFDTFAATRELVAAGRERHQADAIAIVPAQTALTAAMIAGLTFGLLRMSGGAP